MAFDTQTVTLKGAELLAAATAADPLIIVGCDATQTYLTQAQAVNISTRPATPFSNTTSVTQLGSASDHINSRVYFRAGDNTGGDANTLMLYGHKQSAPSDDYVIFVASAQTPFHLPEVGDVVDEWETALDIVYTISTNSVGYATQATYCTLSEFNLLKERTVTTHAEGEPTTGDNQTIYGDKTFKDQILCSSPRGIIWKGTAANSIWVLTNYNGVTIFDSSSNEICSMDATNGTISTTGKFSAVGNNVTSDFTNISANYIDVGSGGIDTTSIGVSGDIVASGSLEINSSAIIDGLCWLNGGTYITDTFKLSKTGLADDWELNVTIGTNAVGPTATFSFPDYDGTGNVPELMLSVGSQSKIELTADSVDVSNALSSAGIYTLATEIGTSGNTNGTLTVYGSVEVGNTGTGDGTLTVNGTTASNYVNCAEFIIKQASKNWIEADNAGLRIYNSSYVRKVEFETDGTSVIDGTLSVSGAITANGGVKGLEPDSTGGSLVVPIGGIVGVLGKDGGYVNTIAAGGSATFSANQVKTCKWNSGTNSWEEGEYIPAGTYKALTGFVYSSGGSSGPVFFIRKS